MKVLGNLGNPIFEQYGVLFDDIKQELLDQGVDINNVIVLYHKDEIRAIRKPLLENADVLVNKALDNADTIAEKKARIYRSKLRGMTNAIGDYIPLNIPVL